MSSPTDSADKRFDPILHGQLWSIVKNVSRYADGRSEDQAIDELTQLVQRAKIAARLNELELVEPLRRDETLVARPNRTMTITARLRELKAELERE